MSFFKPIFFGRMPLLLLNKLCLLDKNLKKPDLFLWNIFKRHHNSYTYESLSLPLESISLVHFLVINIFNRRLSRIAPLFIFKLLKFVKTLMNLLPLGFFNLNIINHHINIFLTDYIPFGFTSKRFLKFIDKIWSNSNK